MLAALIAGRAREESPEAELARLARDPLAIIDYVSRTRPEVGVSLPDHLWMVDRPDCDTPSRAPELRAATPGPIEPRTIAGSVKPPMVFRFQPSASDREQAIAGAARSCRAGHPGVLLVLVAFVSCAVAVILLQSFS